MVLTCNKINLFRTATEISAFMFVSLILSLIFLGPEPALSVLIPIWVLLGYIWLRYLKRPVARISNSKLTVRDGNFHTDVFELNQVEYMAYEIGHKQRVPCIYSNSGKDVDMHVLVIKLKNHQVLRQPITDLDNHIVDFRLYNFIHSNFLTIELLNIKD